MIFSVNDVTVSTGGGAAPPAYLPQLLDPMSSRLIKSCTAEDEGNDDVGDLTKVGRTVGPAHLEGAREDNMHRVGGCADGEDV